MGLMDDIKNGIKNSGSNKSKMMYFKEDDKIRVRFLTDAEDGMQIPWHDSFKQGVDIPCQELFGRECHYCEEEDLRTRDKYVWSVYDYEAEEVRLFAFPANSFTPVPALVSAYETYGTLTDRDYVIQRRGTKQSTSYTVTPMDRSKFRMKAKPYSESAILKILDAAYPDPEAEEAAKSKKKKNKPAKTKSKKEVVEEEEDDDENEYEGMNAKALYKLCRERDIECEPKKKTTYYITLLEEADEAEEDWGDDEDEDWGDEDDEDDDGWD